MPIVLSLKLFNQLKTKMASSVDLNLPNLFGDVLEDNVVFCIDTSGSMHSSLLVIKLHLQETLCKMAADKNKKFFNIIEFNSKVTAWADKLICSTRETSALAMEWVKQLSAQTGTNTLGALQAAFSSPHVDAIYLVTDSLPEQHRTDILDEVVSLSNGRPVHCICITDSVPETALTDFLEDLAVETFGSLQIIQVSTHGYVERVTPVYAANHGQDKMLITPSGGRYTPQKSCSLTSTLQVDPDYWKSYRYLGHPYFHPPFHNYPIWPYYPFCWPNRYLYGSKAWSRFYPARSFLKDQQNEIEAILTPGAGSLLIGKKVLARRHEDGFFYLGSVQSQILLNQFLVAFGPCKHGDFLDTSYQETDVFDIIDYNEAARHSILTGDYVLAPWEPEGEKFRPGKVIHGQETRHSEPRSKDSKLTISFDNGIVANINPDIVVWIPKEFYNRVKMELQMPLSARRYIQSQDGYPRVTKPGYPSSGPQPKPKDYYCINPLSLRQPSFTLLNGGLLPYPQSSKYGPFRETMLQVPLELRDKPKYPDPAEWSSSTFDYVDRFAKHRHQDSVKELLKTPKPPDTPPPTNRQLRRETQIPQHITDEEKAISRQQSRRQAVLARELAWKQKTEKAEQLQKVKEKSQREKVLKRIMEANHLFQEEQRQIQATCDAKKQINAEIQHAIGTKRQFEWQRQDQRLKARQIQRENRDKEHAIKYFKEQEDEATKKKLQFDRSQRHWAECSPFLLLLPFSFGTLLFWYPSSFLILFFTFGTPLFVLFFLYSSFGALLFWYPSSFLILFFTFGTPLFVLFFLYSSFGKLLFWYPSSFLILFFTFGTPLFVLFFLYSSFGALLFWYPSSFLILFFTFGTPLFVLFFLYSSFGALLFWYPSSFLILFFTFGTPLFVLFFLYLSFGELLFWYPLLL
ncbi:unnamed protein product [Acanthosepion pharaonis]|uniref:VWFA domain-containing protein n=1 Tax=Acanthosepion pharaonis TaxID=158019 RepID=A0A812AQ26_ACAPH|nr:unnamed protein product [Sepia pharaonis]